ncbi:MAG: uracil-DNA glycosylase [Acidobacteriota bacterium]
MSKRFDRLIRELASAELSERAVNQYSSSQGDVAGNAVRRRNLRLYLQQLEEIGSRVMLVGEAPSHRGGRLTGIAFVSETLMLAGVDGVLGEERGYRKATTGETLSTEASATMVWGTIRSIHPLPLLWNAFPFHPFHEGNPTSNRVPTASELLIGERFIRMLIELFAFEEVLAIGNQASLSLSRIGISHEKLRHPSMGGKQKFVAGMARLSQASDS